MPVHLFGGPAPLGELAAFGLPLDRGRRAGLRLAGDRRPPGSPRPSASIPTKNLFGLGDGGLVAVRDAELAERIRMLRFHGSKAKTTFEFIGYNSRLDEIQAAVAADLPARARRLDGGAPRGRRALRASSGSASCASSRRRAGPRLPPLRLPLARARPDSRPRSTEARDRQRAVLPAAAPSPARARATSATSRGSLPETERAARENFSRAALGRDRRRAAGARRRRRCAPPSASRRAA